jgi:hypothetical protein
LLDTICYAAHVALQRLHIAFDGPDIFHKTIDSHALYALHIGKNLVLSRQVLSRTIQVDVLCAIRGGLI